MPTKTKFASLSLVCLTALLVAIAQILSSSEDTGAQHDHTDNLATWTWARCEPNRRTTIDFDDVEELFQVGARGAAHFGLVWRGAIDITAHTGISNGRSTDMVALMWFWCRALGT